MSDELKKVLRTSLLGTVGLMWVIGGIALILITYPMHWALGWLTLFVWVWGCWAGALYFDLKRFFSA